jgi:hypothetical protein
MQAFFVIFLIKYTMFLGSNTQLYKIVFILKIKNKPLLVTVVVSLNGSHA